MTQRIAYVTIARRVRAARVCAWRRKHSPGALEVPYGVLAPKPHLIIRYSPLYLGWLVDKINAGGLGYGVTYSGGETLRQAIETALS